MSNFRREFRAFWITELVVLALLVSAMIYFKLDSLHKDAKIRAQAKQAKILALHTKRESSRTTKALCTLRGNLATRVPHDELRLQRSKEFSERNPHGALGFTHAQIVQGIVEDQASLDNLKDSVAALSIVRC